MGGLVCPSGLELGTEEHADVIMPAAWHYGNLLHLLDARIGYAQGLISNQAPLLPTIPLHVDIEGISLGHEGVPCKSEKAPDEDKY